MSPRHEEEDSEEENSEGRRRARADRAIFFAAGMSSGADMTGIVFSKSDCRRAQWAVCALSG